MMHVHFVCCNVSVPGLLETMGLYMQFSRAAVPSWGKALALADISWLATNRICHTQQADHD